MPVERFLAHAIARQKESLPVLVPERHGEHTVEVMQRFVAPLLVTVHDHFSIASRAEAMPETFQFHPQFAEVVNLAVEDYEDRFILVADRLLTAGHVDDRQSGNSESDGAFDVVTDAVRSTVTDRRVLPPQQVTVY